MRPYDADFQLRAALELLLRDTEFIGWLRVGEDGWKGIVMIFAARNGQAYAWRDSDGRSHAVLRTASIDSPAEAIRNWLSQGNAR